MEKVYSNLNITISLLGYFLSRFFISVLIVIILFDYLIMPSPVLASEHEIINNLHEDLNNIYTEIERKNNFVNHLEQSETRKVIKTGYHTITAYTSEVGQCDATPCITANGFNLCEHGIEDSVATNYLPMGTKIRIPEIFGDRVFEVRDRMNKRYYDRFDVWLLDKAEAKKFGVKISLIEILE